MTETATNATAQHFTDRADAFAAILEAADRQWDAPTPCEGWTVRDVVAHTIETERDFLARHGYEVGESPDGSDPAAAWRTHAATVAGVLAQDGVAEREYDGYFGRTTIAATMADFYGWDLVVHGSDVARATGQDWSVERGRGGVACTPPPTAGVTPSTPRVSAPAPCPCPTTRPPPTGCSRGWVATRGGDPPPEDSDASAARPSVGPWRTRGRTWPGWRWRASSRQRPTDVSGMLDAVGPVQSQTARSPFLGLAARFPGVTREAVSAAYEAGTVVRGSTIRGTVHTATPEQYAALGVATRIGQRTLWQRLLGLERSTVEQLWADTEDFAAGWRSVDELQAHLHDWLMEHEGRDPLADQQVGRYLAFGHGGLVRRPVNGDWAGQGAPVYRTLPPVVAATPTDAVLLHLRCHGPASRHDVAWWSKLGMRVVDEAIDGLGLVGRGGPGRAHVRRPARGPRPHVPRRGAAAAGVRRPHVRLRADGPGALRPSRPPAPAVERGQRDGAAAAARRRPHHGLLASHRLRPAAGRWRWCGSPAPAGPAGPSWTRRSRHWRPGWGSRSPTSR